MENLQSLFDSDLKALILEMEEVKEQNTILWYTAQACALFRMAYKLNVISMDDWIKLDCTIIAYEDRLLNDEIEQCRDAGMYEYDIGLQNDLINALPEDFTDEDVAKYLIDRGFEIYPAQMQVL